MSWLGDERRHHRQGGATVKAFTALAAIAALSPASIGVCEPSHPELQSCADGATGVRLQIEVAGVRSNDGVITITVYPDDRRRFLVHRGQIGVLRTSAHSPVTNFCAALAAPGRYAVVVYHDANGDMMFNRTGLGLPAEDYGLSNNSPTFFGLPQFESVLTPIKPGDNAIRIELRRAFR